VRWIQAFARHLCRGSYGSASGSLDWEDVAQEAGRRFFSSGLDGFRSDATLASLKSYLYTIVKATRIQHYRSTSRRRRREEATSIDGPSMAPAVAESRAFLERILGRISTECRELLERSFLDGATNADLAAELGLAESSVRSKLTRCLQRARALVS
jgi:RNA polymerase sigma factor (sigma-70 family)